MLVVRPQWANNQRAFGKAFKKLASERSPTEKTYAKNTTKRHVALLDGIGIDWDRYDTDWAKMLAQLEVFQGAAEHHRAEELGPQDPGEVRR